MRMKTPRLGPRGGTHHPLAHALALLRHCRRGHEPAAVVPAQGGHDGRLGAEGTTTTWGKHGGGNAEPSGQDNVVAPRPLPRGRGARLSGGGSPWRAGRAARRRARCREEGQHRPRHSAPLHGFQHRGHGLDLLLQSRRPVAGLLRERGNVQIPTEAGRGFRFDVGQRSDLKPATIPI